MPLNGSYHFEHFRQGIESAEKRLTADEWTQDGQPIFIPEGFPKGRLN